MKINAELQLRWEEVEQRRRELVEVETKLAHKERELASFVAQLQGSLGPVSELRPNEDGASRFGP